MTVWVATDPLYICLADEGMSGMSPRRLDAPNMLGDIHFRFISANFQLFSQRGLRDVGSRGDALMRDIDSIRVCVSAQPMTLGKKR